MARREASSNRAPGSPPGDASSRRQTSRRYLNGALVLIGGLTSGFPHQGSLGSGGHGVPCGSTMFTKRVSRPVDGLDPYRGRRGREGRANSKKDLVTGPIRGFCAPQPSRLRLKSSCPADAHMLEGLPGPLNREAPVDQDSALRLVLEEHHARVVGPHVHPLQPRVAVKAREQWSPPSDQRGAELDVVLVDEVRGDEGLG